jgi:hypothetical protein
VTIRQKSLWTPLTLKKHQSSLFKVRFVIISSGSEEVRWCIECGV